MPTIETTTEQPKMSFFLFMATEGGRKCPQCCRYAKASELGYLGERITEPAAWSITTREPTHYRTVGFIDGYGHLPGFGCNK